MTLLSGISSPEDLKRLNPRQCVRLASEIRDFLVEAVSRTGGHLGPNLGVVELTLGLHRVFDSPRDRIVWDTGHQAYVHKIVTGRQAEFATLRQPGGLSGYPSRAESAHDVIENSHASTALSYADGLAKAYALRGEHDRSVVAVVGDGALTGGMCWEALNAIAAAKDRPVIIVVNDNGRSYAPTTGGLADHLASLRTAPAYEKALGAVRQSVTSVPFVGRRMFGAMHAFKRGVKDAVQPQVMFEDLGLKYMGPVDGHDIEAVESALRRARRFGGPVLVHCVTRKGFGYAPSERDEADRHHAIGTFEPGSGKALDAPSGESWTDVAGSELVAIAEADPTVVAITAAMLQPVGLGPFQAAFPDRIFDVGIAEQHAVTSAAGLALGGMKPVVCVYATFLNRAFDQVLMDVAMHELPVTFVLDRAGITGPDGASHHGMWDMAWLGVVPGLALAAPRDGATLRSCLREAVARTEGPAVVRFPKGQAGEDIAVLSTVEGVDILARTSPRDDVLLIAVGGCARAGIAAAALADAEGVGVTVVDPRWVLPVSPALVRLAAGRRLVMVAEDGLRAGGIGDAVARALRDAGVDVPVRTVGLPTAFVPQGKREVILRDAGLGPRELAREIVTAVLARTTEREVRLDPVVPADGAPLA
jgi:1-deoxy-D-xylulose-5-phosphate synthase